MGLQHKIGRVSNLVFYAQSREREMIQTESGLKNILSLSLVIRVQELCESRGGRPGLPVLMSHMVSVDVKQH